jgi:hypothetical protein
MGHPNAKFVGKRRKAVIARLKEGYSVEELKEAILGCKGDPFYSKGQNDHKTVYDDLELICRDGTKVEKFIAKYKQPVLLQDENRSNGNGHRQQYRSASERQAESIRKTKASIKKELAEVFDIEGYFGIESDGDGT